MWTGTNAKGIHMMRNIGFIWSRLAVACLFLLPAAVPRGCGVRQDGGHRQMGPFRAVIQEQRAVLERRAGRLAESGVHVAAGRDQRGGRVLGRRQDLARALLARPAGTLEVQDDVLRQGQ